MVEGPLFLNGVMFFLSSLFPSLSFGNRCCHYFDSRVRLRFRLRLLLLFHICAIAALCAVGCSDGISAVYLLTTEMARVVVIDGAEVLCGDWQIGGSILVLPRVQIDFVKGCENAFFSMMR